MSFNQDSSKTHHMNQDRLKITSVDSQSLSTSPSMKKRGRREEIQAKMERMWLQNPEQFNPMRNSIERQRILRTIKAIEENIPLPVSRAVDLGCGYGMISKKLSAAGCHVDAVDAAAQALQHLKNLNNHPLENISLFQQCLPTTTLKDEAYELVVCTDVIGFLEPQEYRFLFSELSRLVSNEGHVVCSAELDIDTEEPLQHFATLAETEFTFETWVFSYHRLYIKLSRFFEIPEKYAELGKDHQKRKNESLLKSGIRKLWFEANSSWIGSKIWSLVALFSRPIAKGIKQSNTLLKLLEPVSRFIWSDDGISHALFIGKRRPLTYQLPADKTPLETKHKRQVWE